MPVETYLIVIIILMGIIIIYSIAHRSKALEDLRREKDYYKKLSAVDPLTLVGNRRSLDAKLEEEIDRSIRTGASVCFALIDVDKFKEVNSSIGHAEADNVLKAIADIIQASIRRSDHVYRFGGDEFAIVMVNTKAAKAVEVVQRINDTITSDGALNVNNISISTGITEFPNSHFGNIGFSPDYSLVASDIITQASSVLLNKAKRQVRVAVFKDS